MKTLTCPECGVTFTKTAHNQTCCSRKCSEERNRTKVREHYVLKRGGEHHSRAERAKAAQADKARITLTCPECGVTFVAKSRHQVYCSKKCANEGHYKRHGQTDAFLATAPVTFANLSKAKTKPRNTSDIRWRMELRRRAMQRQFGLKNMDMLPNPDILGA